MPLNDRIARVDKLKSWADQLPLHYEYTAGVAGERFLRGLKEGKILAARCKKCGTKYLPPKAYCVECYVAIDEFVEVGPEGKASAIARSSVGFEGDRLRAPRAFAFVTFRGVNGGLVHLAGKGVDAGSKVTPRFKPKGKRVGALTDIEEFVA